MKKILVLNGSPKIEKSNTLKITKAFIDGLSKQEEFGIEYIDIYKLKINNCLGCFNCWEKTPGKCIIEDDDMNELINKYIISDIIIWSFPLYYYGMPSKMKAFLDRILPTNKPFISYNYDIGCSHPSRYDLSNQKHLLISTCGFCSIKNNYEGLLKQFDLIHGEGNYEKILCAEGELFRVPQLSGRCNEYLEIVKKAGLEYSINNKIKEETQKELSELLFDEKSFIEMADASWNINEENGNESSDASFNFMRQMKAVFNKKQAEKLDVVLEMFFSNLNKTYQLKINNGECSLIEGSKEEYTTRIETDFDVWKDISEGRISGEQALMEHKYKVLGDFSFMFKMNDIFGGASSLNKIENTKKEIKKNTNMTIFLLPWIIFWALSSFGIEIGIITSLIVSNLIIFIAPLKFELTIYEKINPLIFSIISIASMIFKINNGILFSLTYLIFGLIWLFSGFLRIPLCAWYSQNDYKNAFSNPLFIKTNRIIAIYWGIFYVASFVFNYLFISKFGYTGLVRLILIIINNSIPLLLGIFTVKFSKWYPAKIARG